ncbi:hypothetical protein T492DRAFT_1074043 [Pavlovales sp. CCMP2436]|nr:hypothetical protein T492DRAFT_1074043 [Pavlovales sp. CCMP2436]
MAPSAKVPSANAVAGTVVRKQAQSSVNEQCASCVPSPLKRSFFSAKFLATPPNSMYSIYVADGVKLVDWPMQEMHEFLGSQRQWGQYILRDDKLCRQVVATFYTAYEASIDKHADVPVNPMDLMPYAGEHRPLTIIADADWIAPHLMNTLVGVIVEFGYVPERSAKVLNALVDPMKNRRLVLQVGGVVLLNAVMWIVFCVDYIHAQLQNQSVVVEDKNTTTIDASNSTAVDSNSTATTNTTDLPPEWDYPKEQFPLYMRGVYPLAANGLKGIPAMPFLHYHASQLGVNTVGFLLFGTILVLKHGPTVFFSLSLWLWFFAGCAGISLIYKSTILCREMVCTWDSTQDIVLAFALIALYTGILYGALPQATVYSPDGGSATETLTTWQIDLMGGIGGGFYAIGLAMWLRKSRAFKKKPGHGNKAPTGKRFATSAPPSAGRGASMEMTSSRDNPFQTSATPAAGGFGPPDGFAQDRIDDNPFLSHLQQPSAQGGEASFEQNFPQSSPPPPPAAHIETSYV